MKPKDIFSNFFPRFFLSVFLIALIVAGLPHTVLSRHFVIDINPRTLYAGDPADMQNGAWLRIFDYPGRVAFTVIPSDNSVIVKLVEDSPFDQTYYRLYKKTLGTTQITVRDPDGTTLGMPLTVIQGNKPTVVPSGAANITVPAVMGKTEADARQILEGAGLKVKVFASVITPYKGSSLNPTALASLGKVGVQGPGGGAKVAAGAEVTIGITTSQEYKVPDVRGLKKDAAVNKINNDMGYAVALQVQEEKVTDQGKDDTVLRQSPNPGSSFKLGESITLVVGRFGTLMPNVEGLSPEQATQKLNSLGITNITIRKDSIFYTSDPNKAGKVGSQLPFANGQITDPKTVKVFLDLLLLKGSDIKVPYLIMTTGDSAVNMIKTLGLTPKVDTYKETNRELWGKVIQQDPRPDTVVKKGQTVTIRVAQAALQMPALIGMPEAQALSSLKNIGLNPTVKDQQTNVRDQDGKVLLEDPKVGATLDPGTPVTITVGRYKPTVPNLIGLSEAEARKALDDRGIKIASINYVKALKPTDAGKIITQSIAGGLTYQGAPIILTVGK